MHIHLNLLLGGEKKVLESYLTCSESSKEPPRLKTSMDWKLLEHQFTVKEFLTSFWTERTSTKKEALVSKAPLGPKFAAARMDRPNSFWIKVLWTKTKIELFDINDKKLV